MRTFDQAIYELYKNGKISYENALAHADSENDLRLMIKLGAEADPDYLDKVAGDLSIQDDNELM